MHNGTESIGSNAVEQEIYFHQVRLAVPVEFIVEAGVTL